MQSRAGSAILRLPEAQALMMGERMSSDSVRESSVGPPSCRTPGEVSGSDCGEVGVKGEGFLSGEVVRRSRTDLDSWTSLECFRQEPFLMIFSRAGMRTWLRRESASEEAIPNVGRGGLWRGQDLPRE